MANASPVVFTRLADGTLLQRQLDGTFRPVASATDHARVSGLSPEEIERMSASDPDHAALDDRFWAAHEGSARDDAAISIDQDVLQFFRRGGSGYQARINAVLRSYMRARDEHR